MADLRVCVFCGSQPGVKPEYVAVARQLGGALAREGYGLVYGGGAVGIMGAVSDAVVAAGGEVIGVIPQALRDMEQGRDDIDLRIVSDMHERKALMYELSDAIVVLPGGIGTFEEFFEVFTWAKLGFHAKPIIVYNVGDYYTPLVELLSHAEQSGFLWPTDRGLVTFVTTVQATMSTLKHRLDMAQ